MKSGCLKTSSVSLVVCDVKRHRVLYDTQRYCNLVWANNGFGDIRLKVEEFGTAPCAQQTFNSKRRVAGSRLETSLNLYRGGEASGRDQMKANIQIVETFSRQRGGLSLRKPPPLKSMKCECIQLQNELKASHSHDGTDCSMENFQMSQDRTLKEEQLFTQFSNNQLLPT